LSSKPAGRGGDPSYQEEEVQTSRRRGKKKLAGGRGPSEREEEIPASRRMRKS
jgi:hypothetical protein